MGTFKKGLFLGGLLGAGLMWLNATPKGKELRAKISQHIEPLFNELKNSLKQLEGPTKDMYDALVERAVATYSDKKELADDVKVLMVRQLKKRWKEVQKELK
jgi:gas vesicle protein